MRSRILINKEKVHNERKNVPINGTYGKRTMGHYYLLDENMRECTAEELHSQNVSFAEDPVDQGCLPVYGDPSGRSVFCSGGVVGHEAEFAAYDVAHGAAGVGWAGSVC